MNDKEPQFEHFTTSEIYEMIRRKLLGSLALTMPTRESGKNKGTKKKKKK